MSARRAALLVGACALVALAAQGAPAGACACGIAIEAEVTEERALVIEGDQLQRIILSLDLATAPGGRAAVVLPVPAEPEVEAIAQGDPLAYLDAATAPPPATAAAGSGGEDTAAAPVDLLGRETVGGYDVSRLRAADSGALAAWLERNDYTLPPEAEPILGDYVDEGWAFVAIRLAEGSAGRLKPLQVSFDRTGAALYPMRLSQLSRQPVDLTLYVLAAGARKVDGLEAVWNGTITELVEPPPPELESLFTQGSFVTRLEAEAVEPEAFTADLVIEPVDDVAAAAGETGSSGDEEGGAETAAIVAVALVGVALAAALRLAAGGRLPRGS